MLMFSWKKIILISILLHIVAAFFSKGYDRFDEHFQILEFAGLKFGINNAADLPWEYHFQMRSAFQPWIVVECHHLLALFNDDNPFHLALILRLLSAALSVLALVLLCKVLIKEIQKDILRKWFILLT